ncbi:MAG TPA: 6-phosphogluconolactonase [Steroidobacteraceae bacterium]
MRRFADETALIGALATEIVASVEDAQRAGRPASLLVSGGRSPAALFDKLSATEIDWSRIWVGLADERWVDPRSSDSNERLLREHLLRGSAAEANFVGLKNDAATPAAGAAASWQSIKPLPRPFDYVVLGMGTDGHTASLFPKSPGLAKALDGRQAPACVAMIAPVEPNARLSLNLSALLNARHVALLLIGSDKWNTYDQARKAGPVEQMPVRALLRQQQVPVTVYWAP